MSTWLYVGFTCMVLMTEDEAGVDKLKFINCTIIQLLTVELEELKLKSPFSFTLSQAGIKPYHYTTTACSPLTCL